MVLQREQDLTLTGQAGPQADVRVRFRDREICVRADKSGQWKAVVPTGAAGGPFTMEVASGMDRIALCDIFVGEVWLAGGQSNMVFRLADCSTAGEDLPLADLPRIRFFKTAMVTSETECADAPGDWTPVCPQTAGEVSAVAYHFAKRVHEGLGGVPVGIIQSAWGGSKIEPWIGEDGYRDLPGMAGFIEQRSATLSGWQQAAAEFAARIEAWYAAHPDLPRHGHLDEDLAKGLHLPGGDPQRWQAADLPFVKEPILMSQQNGVVWFRREVEIPEQMTGRELVLDLGLVDAQRIVYFNGQEVSRTTDATPMFWLKPEVVAVPAGLVKAGRATIAVRCLFQFAGGNPYPSRPRVLCIRDESVRIPVDGGWRCTVAGILGEGWPATGGEPRPWPVPPVPWDLGRPASMFNAMIAPFTGMPLRGVIWYQGESNADDPEGYRKLLTGLIANWRQRWQNPAIAFGIVQLAGFGDQADGPIESVWARFRQVQFEVAQADTRCGIATAVDVGDVTNIHPANKRPVGRRLAGWALARVYGKDLEWSGPQVRQARVEQGRLLARFAHFGDGLRARHDPLRAFDVMDAHGAWRRREGRIRDSATAEVDLGGLEDPQRLRYAWGNTPECDLENSSGLPAFPFDIDLCG